MNKFCSKLKPTPSRQNSPFCFLAICAAGPPLPQTMKLFLLLMIAVLFVCGSDACQSCLLDLTHGLLLRDDSGVGKNHRQKHQQKHQHFVTAAPIIGRLPLSLRKTIASGRGFSPKGIDASFIGFLTLRKCIIAAATVREAASKKLKTNVMVNDQHNALAQQQKRDNKKWLRIFFDSESKEAPLQKEEEKCDANAASNSNSDDMSSSMIMAIGFYKKFISPLLPPACRFLPTCSQYGVQAIEKFGPTKGVILTAWRLARCSPFGGKGYDPPIWPPVPYWYGSY